MSSGYPTVRPKTLFVSYDGLLEPLGQGQILNYLIGLAVDYDIHIVSFEKPLDLGNVERVERVRQIVRQHGLNWHPLRYHKRPRLIATLFDIALGIALCCWLSLVNRIAIFHARNILCAAILTPASWISRGQLLTDIRGFWPDERVDGGLIQRNGATHRVLKTLERYVLKASAHIVTLTERSVPILRDDPSFGRPRAPISVIPTCVDLNRFELPNADRVPTGIVMGYVGSVGTWYMFDETVTMFMMLLERVPDAQMLIVNRGDHDVVRETLEARGVPQDRYSLVEAEFSKMPDQLHKMSFAASMIRPVFSKISSSPTKVAEYLACGLPCLGTYDVGDLGPLLTDNNVGVAVRKFDDEELALSVDRIVALCSQEGIAQRCRAVAESHFSLTDGVRRYAAIYAGLCRNS